MEIDYGLYDKVSDLQIESLTDGAVREFADRRNKTYPEMHNIFKKELDEVGVRYMIPGSYLGGNLEIKCVVKGSLSACGPEYFDTYKEAQTFLEMSKFDRRYKYIMNLAPDVLRKEQMDELIDLAEDRVDFAKIEGIHQILISRKLKDMKIGIK